MSCSRKNNNYQNIINTLHSLHLSCQNFKISFQRALLPIFLLVINVFSVVRAQTFTIVSDRIEYIDPETHYNNRKPWRF